MMCDHPHRIWSPEITQELLNSTVSDGYHENSGDDPYICITYLDNNIGHGFRQYLHPSGRGYAE